MFTMFAACLSACSSNDPDENTPKEKPQDINFMVVSELEPLLDMNKSEILDFMENLGFSKTEYPYADKFEYYFTRKKESIVVEMFETSTVVLRINYEAENMDITPAQAAEWFEYHGKSVKLGSKNLPLQEAFYEIDENEGGSYNGLINGLKNCTGEEELIDAVLVYSSTEEIERNDHAYISYTKEYDDYNSIEITISHGFDDFGKMEGQVVDPPISNTDF